MKTPSTLDKCLALALVAGIASFSGTAKAASTSIDFTFSGGTDGVLISPVTGTIYGIIDNGILQPTSVLANSGSYQFTFDASTASATAGNGFTIANGNVTAANYIIVDNNRNIKFNWYGANMLESYSNPSGSDVYDYRGFSGVTYKVVAGDAVPEPSAVVLLGLGTLGLVARRRC